MADISQEQLLAAATAQCPGLFSPRNNDVGMEQARANALGFVANGLRAAGLSVEGYDGDFTPQLDEQAKTVDS